VQKTNFCDRDDLVHHHQVRLPLNKEEEYTQNRPATVHLVLRRNALKTILLEKEQAVEVLEMEFICLFILQVLLLQQLLLVSHSADDVPITANVAMYRARIIRLERFLLRTNLHSIPVHQSVVDDDIRKGDGAVLQAAISPIQTQTRLEQMRVSRLLLFRLLLYRLLRLQISPCLCPLQVVLLPRRQNLLKENLLQCRLVVTLF